MHHENNTEKFCEILRKTIDKLFWAYYNYTHNLNITKNNDCDEDGRNDMQCRELSGHIDQLVRDNTQKHS